MVDARVLLVAAALLYFAGAKKRKQQRVADALELPHPVASLPPPPLDKLEGQFVPVTRKVFAGNHFAAEEHALRLPEEPVPSVRSMLLSRENRGALASALRERNLPQTALPEEVLLRAYERDPGELPIDFQGGDVSDLCGCGVRESKEAHVRKLNADVLRDVERTYARAAEYQQAYLRDSMGMAFPDRGENVRDYGRKALDFNDN